MIVREIKDNHELMYDFDWFNDYDDTRPYVAEHCPEILELFDKGFKEWIRKHNRAILTRS